MPIQLDPATGEWITKDLTSEEKDSLITIAKQLMVDELGEMLATKIFQSFAQSQTLHEIPKEQMFEA